MSNIYIKEPPTNGKVLLHTSMGDIDVELWSKEAPLACRNFVQLCLEGYYNGTIFHRIVPNFIVQGGDPLGTGEGGDSIYGQPFKDEFHSRLRFVRRGLVAMANAGPNDNSSQFFFTLASCMDLNKKHTIFGKIAGDTIYNLVQLGEVQTDENERPINPPCIKSTKVLANPFDDIVPRVSIKKEKSQEKQKSKSEMKATKDFKLLSFGEEAEEEENENILFGQTYNASSKSSHDLTNDPKLSSVPAVDKTEDRELKRQLEVDQENAKRLKIVKEKLKTVSLPPSNKDSSKEVSKTNSSSDELRKESRRLAREILNSKKPKQVDRVGSSGSSDDAEDDSTLNPEFAEYKRQKKLYRAKTSSAMSKTSGRENDTLALLQRFNEKLHSTRDDVGWTEDQEDNDPDGEDDGGWLLHRLKKVDEVRDAKDMNREVNEDRYDLSDPRNPLNKRRREKSKKGKKERR